jgi:plasmid stability protein
MASITLKDVPDDLHERLRAAAEASGRSLNKLILTTLERSLGPRRIDRPDLLERIRSRRVTMNCVLDDDLLHEAIREGRE